MSVLRFGVIGASPGASWGFTAHVPAILSLPDARISAVATTREASAKEAAGSVGAEEWYVDAESLANSDAVDAVAVVVKVPAHERAVEAALAAGKPVYCEWPLALDAATAERWASMARDKGITTAVGLQARNGHAIVELHRMLSEGLLGDIRAVEGHACRARGLAGRPVTKSGSYTLDAANGAGTREVLGGHLLGLVDHLVRIASLEGRALAPYPATLADTEGNEHKVTAPDTFVASGTLAGGGLLSVSWWDRDPDPRTRIVIHGTAGTAFVSTQPGVPVAQNQPQMAPLQVEIVSMEGERRTILAPASDLSLASGNVAATYRGFIDDLRNGTGTVADFSTAARIHALLDSGVPRTAD